jgi:multidrug efflux pump subunit AcrA (membrane-fusion protein)
MAMPGAALLIVEDTSRYRFEATVSASVSPIARRGSKARVELDAQAGKALEGTVSELEAGADAGSQTLKVKIDLPHAPAIRSGFFGRAWFVRGERRGLMVARADLIERGQLTFVYAVDAQGIARLRMVTLGRRSGEAVEILSGLSEHDRIVAEPANRELDGKKVTP